MKKQLLLFALMLLPMMASAYDVKLDGIYYNLYRANSKNTATVTYQTNRWGPNGQEYISDYSGNIVIPSEIVYDDVTYKVTGITKYAFYDCDNITSITIPDGITTIGERAFQSCENITSINIPNSVTSIGIFAFQNCSSLSTVTIGSGLGSLPEGVFKSTGLISITLPNNIRAIGKYAFDNCSHLTTITMGNNIGTIGEYAFYVCNSISDVYCYTEMIKAYDVNNDWSQGCPLGQATLHVPITSINLYKSLYPWRQFKNIVALPEPIFILTYLIDGIEYKSYKMKEGEVISSEPTPIKEGYTFSGWSEIPETMPSNDVTITGSFVINNYKLTYMIDENIYKVVEYEFGATIIPEMQPEGDYASFEWVGLPETMPAKDVTIYANYENTPDEQCAKPTIYYTDGKLSYKSETEGVTFFSTITDSDINRYIEEEVPLTVTYHISVYASKEGFGNSDVAEATLCWIEVDPQKEGITEETATEAKQLQAMPVLIQAEGGEISIDGAPEGTKVAVYDAGGVEVGTAISRGGKTLVPAHLPQGSIAIVKIGEKAVKVAVK